MKCSSTTFLSIFGCRSIAEELFSEKKSNRVRLNPIISLVQDDLEMVVDKNIVVEPFEDMEHY
jgi:hypothetical protein